MVSHYSELVSRNLNDTYHLQLFKLAHGAIPVMQQQKRFKYSSTDTCHCCGNEEETSMHMLKFQLQNTDKWKKELQDSIKNNDIGPHMRSLITHVITRFATDTD